MQIDTGKIDEAVLALLDRVFFWLRHCSADARAIHVGFVAKSEAEIDAFYAAHRLQ